MNDFINYGFNIQWFMRTYNSLNYPNSIEEINIDKINSLYEKYYLNYEKFIIELNLIPDEHIPFYLKREKKCLKCQKNYPFKFDSFLHVKEIKTKKEITKELCYSCITKHKNCSKCQKKIQPNQTLYLNQDDSICQKCAN